MKRIFRAAIVLVPVTVLLISIGLWRHHTFKIMDAEPEIKEIMKDMYDYEIQE